MKIKFVFQKPKSQNIQKPFLLTPIPIIKVTPLFPNSSTISKYLICIAAFVSNSSALCFRREAASTSALLLMIVAYPNLLCLAAEFKSL